MSVQPKPRVTAAEYLAAERLAVTKSEYYAGEVFALAGTSKEHNLIVTNLVALLVPRLRGRCSVFASDLRVKVQASGLYTYPDVAVVCGKPEMEDGHLDTLLNPTLLIEVLSPTTEKYDRGRKAEHYRRVETLREHLLIAQDQPHVQRYRRHGQRDWMMTEFSDFEETVELDSIECTLGLGDIYADVLPR